VVVDPVGAGDAFAGGYLYGYLAGRDPVASARLGSAMAARVVATTGDNDGLPSRAEAAELLADLDVGPRG
jgi:2-dehydro-3-deoxygluconokinase